MSDKPNETRQIRTMTLAGQDNDPGLERTTPAERWAMMWQLTLDAWAFKGEPLAEPRLQRDIVRVFKRKG